MALLTIGSRGSEVVFVQQRLAQRGYPLTVDGIYGPETARQVSAFQRDNNLAVNGIAGPQTMAALASAITAQPSPPTTTSATTPNPYTAPDPSIWLLPEGNIPVWVFIGAGVAAGSLLLWLALKERK